MVSMTRPYSEGRKASVTSAWPWGTDLGWLCPVLLLVGFLEEGSASRSRSTFSVMSLPPFDAHTVLCSQTSSESGRDKRLGRPSCHCHFARGRHCPPSKPTCRVRVGVGFTTWRFCLPTHWPRVARSGYSSPALDNGHATTSTMAGEVMLNPDVRRGKDAAS